MNKSKPFLTGLGIGLIVAGLTVQTSHWLTQAKELQLPSPAIEASTMPQPSPVEGIAEEQDGAPKPSPVASVQSDPEKEELKNQVELLRKRTERLKNELAAKPVVKVYILNTMGSFTISSILKRSGVIDKQGPFMDLYAQLPGFQVKEGLYEFRSGLTAEEALFILGAPVPTPVPSQAPIASAAP